MTIYSVLIKVKPIICDGVMFVCVKQRKYSDDAKV